MRFVLPLLLASLLVRATEPTDPAAAVDPPPRVSGPFSAPAQPAARALASVAVVPQETPAQDLIVVSDHGLTIALDESGVRLADLLAASVLVLGRPVLFNPQEVGATQLSGVGSLRCSPEDYRALLDDLLLAMDFVTWDDAGPKGAVHVRRSGAGGPRLGVNAMPGQLVTPGEHPARNTATYTAVFRLGALDARAAMAMFNVFVDNAGESLRNVEGANLLIVTALSMERLQRVADLVAAADRPMAEWPEMPARLEQLEQRVADLEQSLESLAGKAVGR